MLGDLVQTTAGKWITHPPTRCPNGHPLGPNRVLVGHQPCLGHGGGHTTWACRACDQTVYRAPLNTQLHGARRACGGADLESIVTNKGGLRVRPALDNHAVVLQPDIGVALSRCLFHLIGEALSRRCL